jgi:hypothetical protein
MSLEVQPQSRAQKLVVRQNLSQSLEFGVKGLRSGEGEPLRVRLMR